MRLFYFILLEFLKKIKTNTDAAFNAMILLSLLEFANISTLLSFLNLSVTKLEVYLITLGINIPLWWINKVLLYDKRNDIRKRYENISKPKKLLGIVELTIYVILSFVLL
jgi:tmRNA-binding protein